MAAHSESFQCDADSLRSEILRLESEVESFLLRLSRHNLPQDPSQVQQGLIKELIVDTNTVISQYSTLLSLRKICSFQIAREVFYLIQDGGKVTTSAIIELVQTQLPDMKFLPFSSTKERPKFVLYFMKHTSRFESVSLDPEALEKAEAMCGMFLSRTFSSSSNSITHKKILFL